MDQTETQQQPAFQTHRRTGKAKRRPDGEKLRLPEPAPQYRRVMRRTIETIHERIAKDYAGNVVRGIEGRYVWNPQARLFLERLAEARPPVASV
jgi:hypothetical protein